MANANKNKGKAYERVVAKKLSEVFNENFERVPNSGAFTGGKNNQRRDKLTESQKLLTDGDIICPESLSHVKIECKAYKDFPFNTLLSSNATLDGWINQIESNDHLWFVIFKINRKGEFIVFDKKCIDFLNIPGQYCLYKNKYIVTNFIDFIDDNADTIRNARTQFAT